MLTRQRMVSADLAVEYQVSTRCPPHAARGLRWGAPLVVVSLGCPQLLDDDFATLPGQSGAGASGNGAGGNGPSLGGSPSNGGGGSASGDAGDAGAGNAGGAMGGGSNEEPDASTSGGTSGVDAGPRPLPEAGVPDPQTPLGFVIRHRYSFDGSGTVVTDSVGSAPGTALGGAQLAGAGKITLSGDGQYVNLPNGIISGLDSTTIEAWVNWAGDPDPLVTSSTWQTLFSFGNNAAGEDEQSDEATTYVFLTPKANESFDVRGAYTIDGFDGELRADGPDALPAPSDPATGTHVALVVDSAAGVVRLYVEGALAATSSAGSIDLSAIDDVNNWIGRSQFSIDPDFEGDVLEFRIYGAALSASDLSLSLSLGPDAVL